MNLFWVNGTKLNVLKLYHLQCECGKYHIMRLKIILTLVTVIRHSNFYNVISPAALPHLNYREFS